MPVEDTGPSDLLSLSRVLSSRLFICSAVKILAGVLDIVLIVAGDRREGEREVEQEIGMRGK